ncbi:MAG: ExbD/TolR family protein [Elusimicrobiota bacterium]
MKHSTETDEAISGVNIIPVIDVTLVLLVVLLVMSPVINIPGLNVNLPEAMTKETKDENLTVSLSAEGQISVDQDVVLREQLPAMLMKKLKDRQDTVIIVRADKSLPYGAVESLIREVNKFAGNNAVAIATKQRSSKIEGVQQ